jgi:hypothetical protein
MMVIGGWVLFKRDEPHGPHSNFFWPQRDNCCCWIEDNNVLFVIHTPNTETGQTEKCYQNYYPKLRSNIGVGVLVDQILTTHMNVSGMEPTYTSSKEARVLMYYI